MTKELKPCCIKCDSEDLAEEETVSRDSYYGDLYYTCQNCGYVFKWESWWNKRVKDD
jgi:uncharacterized Zn finger protein